MKKQNKIVKNVLLKTDNKKICLKNMQRIREWRSEKLYLRQKFQMNIT